MSAVMSVYRNSFVQKVLIIISMLALSVASFAQEQELAIEIDMAPLFSSIMTYVPIFLAILAIPGGIMIAMLLARWVINAVAAAFRGQSI